MPAGQLAASLLAALLLAPPPAAPSPDLSIAGDRFAVDGQPRFLLFVSYFDGLRASDATLAEDFAYFRRKGVGGVRVLPNWLRQPANVPASDSLVDAAGAIRPAPYARLAALLAQAADHDLIVDLSFSAETIDGSPAFATEARGIVEVARRLKDAGHRHVLVDLQNEWDLHGVTVADLRALRAELRVVDPRRIVTASSGRAQSADDARAAGLDAIAYHDPRDYTACGGSADWWSATGARVRQLRDSRPPPLPIYFQEPDRFEASGCGRPALRAAQFLAALRQARDAGAAAWTYHTRAGFDLSRGSFRSRMRADVEAAFFDGAASLLQTAREPAPR